MEHFTITAVADMHLIYGLAEGNAREAEGLNCKRYPQEKKVPQRLRNQSEMALKCLFEFRPDRRTTMTPRHRQLLSFREEVRNLSLIARNDPVKKLFAVIRDEQAAQLRNREVTVLPHALSLKFNKIIIDEGRSLTALFVMDTLTNFGNLLTLDVRPIDLTELTMNFNLRNALCAFKNFITDRTSQVVGEGIRAAISDHCYYHATGTRRDLFGQHMIDTP
ncbi:hypothetical protein TNCV_3811201 [Trichonephila clavipes]|nr:hypothetical protein TNCV_3811201 [Trichonephila clavipes]